MERKPLLLILLLFSLLTLYHSAALPLGEADDETDHYQYLRFVARSGHPPFTAEEREEAGFKGGLAPLYYWLAAWPVALVGEETRPDIRRVDGRPERHIPTDGLGINHVLHTLDEQWPWRGQPLAWHLVRLLSLPLGWVTILAVYGLVRRLRPRLALTAAALVAFLPRFVISSAVINDDNLVFALLGLLLLVEVIILQGDRRPALYGLLGGVFGLSLITKYYSLILIPEILLVLGLGRAWGRRLLLFMAGLGVTAGPWFIFIMVRFNRIESLGLIPGLAASLGEPQITEGLTGLLSGRAVRPEAATYPLGEWLGLVYRSFWFEYGWMRIFGPLWLYGLVTIFVGLALAGLMAFVRHRPRFGPVGWLLGLRLGLFGGVLAARYILSATIDTGQGRHLYPALPVIALLLAGGLARFRSRLLRAAFCLLLAVMSLLAPSLIRPHYRILPVTIRPPAELPITHRHDIPFAGGLRLAGFDLDPAAAEIRLYWHAEQEAERDYLLSVCLDDGRPVTCWRGHFADGRYPARAWEKGDTLIDTIHLPRPACLPAGGTYRLRLELRSLAPDSASPRPEEPPVLVQTFAEPVINLAGSDSAATIWPEPEADSAVERRTSLTYLAPATPTLQAARHAARWHPLARTPLPDGCGGHLYHFLADPTLPPDLYTNDGLSLALGGRQRQLPPLQSPLRFDPYLSPLSLEWPDQPPLDLAEATSPQTRLTTPTGAALPVTIRWQARRWMAEPLILSLKLVDKDFAIGGERVASLGGRYPNVLWAPGEIVAERYRLQPRPAVPPGLYRLEIGLIRTRPGGYENLPLVAGQENLGHNLYPVVVRLLDPAHDTPPDHPMAAQLGRAIRLQGYDLTAASDRLELALHWQADAPVETDYTVFTQLIGPDGQVWAQWDNPPQAGRYPTTAWTANDRIIDRYTLTLRPGAPPGQYRLLTGLYDPATGHRLPVRRNGQLQPDQALELTRLSRD